jgi:hypothetical protein
VDLTKAFFRYLRGELLNGFYIRKLNLFVNKLSSLEALKAELLYWLHVQFNEKTGLNVMRDKDVEGIAQVAGILSVRGLTDFLIGWFRLSESHIVGGKERSERGLLDQEAAEMVYVRTAQDSYASDIATIATDALRMSLIPDGIEPIGYIYGDLAGVLLDTGKINTNFLRVTPPTGYERDPVTNKWTWTLQSPAPIYAPWYGDKFMALTTTYFSLVELPDTLLTYLFSAQQRIKYNGLGLYYLLEATTEIIPDLITDLKIEILDGFEHTSHHAWYYRLTFTRLDYNFSVLNGWVRFAAWAYFVRSKFPLIQFNDTGE